MSTEQIDIVITDRVDPGINEKLLNITHSSTAAYTSLAMLQSNLNNIDTGNLGSIATAFKNISTSFNSNSINDFGGFANLAGQLGPINELVRGLEDISVKQLRATTAAKNSASARLDNARAIDIEIETMQRKSEQEQRTAMLRQVLDQTLSDQRNRGVLEYQKAQVELSSAITQSETLQERLTISTNQAAASFNVAAQAAISEEAAIVSLNQKYVALEVAKQSALAGGVTNIPQATIRTFNPVRGELQNNVAEAQRLLEVEKQFAKYRIENEGATLKEITAEQQLTNALIAEKAAMTDVVQAESQMIVARSVAVISAVREAEAIAQLNMREVDLAIAVQKAKEAGVANLNLSNINSFNAQRAAIEATTTAAKNEFNALTALTQSKIQAGATTQQEIISENKLKQTLLEGVQVTNSAAKAELDLANAVSQSTIQTNRALESQERLNRVRSSTELASGRLNAFNNRQNGAGSPPSPVPLSENTNPFQGQSLASLYRQIGAAVGLTVTINQLVEMADQLTVLQNKLIPVTDSIGEANTRLNSLAEIASRTYSPLADVTSAYSRFQLALNKTGTSQKDVLSITETVTKALKLGGATASETSSALLQLSQAFNSGQLQGDELRSISENAPLIKQALFDRFGGDIIGFRKKVQDGTVGINELRQVLLDLGDVVDSQYTRFMPTLNDQMTVFANNMTMTLGTLTQTTGVFNVTGQAIAFLAENMKLVVVAGAALLSAGLVAGIIALLPAITAVGAALLGPFALVAAGTAAAVVGVVLFKDKFVDAFNSIEVGGVKLQDIWKGLTTLFAEEWTKALESIKSGFTEFMGFIKKGKDALPDWMKEDRKSDFGIPSLSTSVPNVLTNGSPFAQAVQKAINDRIPTETLERERERARARTSQSWAKRDIANMVFTEPSQGFNKDNETLQKGLEKTNSTNPKTGLRYGYEEAIAPYQAILKRSEERFNAKKLTPEDYNQIKTQVNTVIEGFKKQYTVKPEKMTETVSIETAQKNDLEKVTRQSKEYQDQIGRTTTELKINNEVQKLSEKLIADVASKSKDKTASTAQIQAAKDLAEAKRDEFVAMEKAREIMAASLPLIDSVGKAERNRIYALAGLEQAVRLNNEDEKQGITAQQRVTLAAKVEDAYKRETQALYNYNLELEKNTAIQKAGFDPVQQKLAGMIFDLRKAAETDLNKKATLNSDIARVQNTFAQGQFQGKVQAAGTSLYNSNEGARLDLEAKTTALTEQYAGNLNSEQFVIELNKIRDAQNDLKLSFEDTSPFEAMGIGLEKALNKYKTVGQQLSEANTTFFSGIKTSFADSLSQAIVSGGSFSEKFLSSFRNLGAQVLSTLLQIALQSLLTGQSLSALFAQAGGGGGLFGGIGGLISGAVGLFGGGGGVVANTAGLANGIGGAVSSSSGLLYSLPGRASGGYAGDVSTSEVAGVYHGGEYVMNARSTARNRAALEAMNAGMQLDFGRNSSGEANIVIENKTTGRIDRVTTTLQGKDRRILIEEIADTILDSKSRFSKNMESSYSGITRRKN